MMKLADPLESFLPPVRQWFRQALGVPTPAQSQGWPAIIAGQHTLVLAPTGSGKTLAAFLACLDQLWRQDPLPAEVRVLYISPLKALNNDIHRNLQRPLEGVARAALELDWHLPEVRVAVRTGDTSASERQQQVRRPAPVLITTPESLHLLLTSRARAMLRGVTHCIVDEIHALCGNKRGVFLALLLERLTALVSGNMVRIGLSATQQPLDEVARFLGGSEQGSDGQFHPRPVTIVDAGYRKELDLRVLSPVERFGALPEKSIWPSIYRLLGDEVRKHRSTIIFANNRRTVERITAHLNANDDQEESEAALAHAHHGSVALETRRSTERALKEGRLAAVVATASLELGIDMGAVDLVCQVESPGSVARGLQRVGRAGHLFGQRSKGRLIAKTPGDLLEQAVLARAMAAGAVEALRVPTNCLDVLAQQLVAMAAMDDWDVPALYACVRRALPYRDLSPQAFDSVLEMISGRYCPASEASATTLLSSFKPRVSWDRIHNRLLALPGSQQLALINGGTIPDSGQYAAYSTNGVRIGELDEEFIYERRVGDAFLLGTNAWRLERIEADRVIVTPAEGAPALIPFWHGEQAGRSHDLGLAMGGFLRELQGRLDDPGCASWLEKECLLDASAARNLQAYVRRQQAASGVLPTDRTLVIEASRDPLGDWQVILLSPLGSRLHLTLRLALEARLRQRLGYCPQCLHHDDGILIRLADTDAPVLDLLSGLTAENIEELILGELADSALFALRFRQNAVRALLLPRNKPGRRAPLWLQRLRGRDLLQAARRFRDFPIVAETFRECLHDHLDIVSLQKLLRELQAGQVNVVTRRAEVASPFAGGILFAFTAASMYQDDQSPSDPRPGQSLDRDLLEQLIAPERQGHLLDPRAVHQVERRLRGVGRPPRSATEMAEWLHRLGDVSPAELEGPMEKFLDELEADGRAKRLCLPRCREPERWVAAEEEATYLQAFGMSANPGHGSSGSGAEDTPAIPAPSAPHAAAATILQRFLATHALVGLSDVLGRYPFDREWVQRQMAQWSRAGQLVEVQRGAVDGAGQWSSPANWDQVQRSTLALLRREIVSCPPQQFADFVLRWQGVHPATCHGGAEGLSAVLMTLQGFMLPARLWEQVFLPARIREYQPRWLDEWIATGEGAWACQAERDDGAMLLAFVSRDDMRSFPPPAFASGEPTLPASAERVLDCVRVQGAAFVADLAHQTGLPPAEVRTALWTLVRRRLVTNDSLEAVRRGDESTAVNGSDNRPGVSGRLSLSSLVPPTRPHPAQRHRAGHKREGRWSLLAWATPDPEAHTVFQARLLLQRYGIVARELALLDPWMPPWRVLYEVLSRMELLGAVRRGYFVEGLSGAQFALPEAISMLQDTAQPSTALAPVLLLHTLDPANLYGSAAPFDIPLLDGGTRPLARRAGNWLMVRAGLPLLIVEHHGKRLTALANASREDLIQAVALLKEIMERKGSSGRYKLTVEEWNGQPVATTSGREFLEAAGFVSDYQAMTLYASAR